MRLLPLFIYQYDYINWTANLHFFSDSYKKSQHWQRVGITPKNPMYRTTSFPIPYSHPLLLFSYSPPTPPLLPNYKSNS